EDLRAGGGELHGEGKVVKPPAQLGDGVVALEPGARPEEVDGFRVRHGGYLVLELATDPEQLSARDKELQVRATLQKGRELGSCSHDLLEVVQHAQHLAPA